MDDKPRFVCSACGKQSPTRYPSAGSQPGWDVSCAMHAVWARPATEEDAPEPGGKWVAVDEPRRCRSLDGVVHVVCASYPKSADTLCGERIECSEFWTDSDALGISCDKCRAQAGYP